MKKSRQEWLIQLRRCVELETLEKVIERSRYYMTNSELEAFNSAADHRLAEIITHRLYDRVPASVWRIVR